MITIEARFFFACDYFESRWCYRPEMLPAPPCVYLMD